MARETQVETPPVNVYESSDQLTVALPIPGAHHDTVTVHLDGRRLTIESEPRYPQEQQHYLQHEWSVGSSRRAIELPKPVNPGGAKAMLTHGILTISLPTGKAQEPTSRIRIPVTEPATHQGQPH